MKQLPSAPDTLVVYGDFGGFTPEEMFAYFTQPEKLLQWWPKEAVVDLEVGGEYCFSWSEQNWHVRGTYSSILPGRHLGFTWRWDHESDSILQKQVDIWFEGIEDGCRIAIYQGPFPLDEQENRQSTAEGWIHFGMRLAGLRTGDSD